jgi:hypothetical protein
MEDTLCKIKNIDGKILIVMDKNKQPAWCSVNNSNKGTCKILNYEKLKSYNNTISTKKKLLEDVTDDTGIICYIDNIGSAELLDYYPSKEYNLGDYITGSSFNNDYLILKNKNEIEKDSYYKLNSNGKKIFFHSNILNNVNNLINTIINNKKIDIDEVNNIQKMSNEIYETHVYNVIDIGQIMKDYYLYIIIIILFIIVLGFGLYHYLKKKN